MLIAMTLLLVGAGGWWAGRATVASPAADLLEQAARPTTVEVVDATVGRAIPVNVTVAQPAEPLASNHLPGVVTAVTSTSSSAQGDVVFSIAGVPVRVVKGATPFYRPLALGTEGSDVGQLQQALVELGFLQGKPTGRFDQSPRTALRAWQKQLGVTQTGTAALGELIAVPELPAALRIGPNIRPGSALAGGEVAILGRTGTQEFTLVLSDEQGATLTPEARIRVHHGARTWQAQVTRTTTDENGQLIRVLASPAGGPVCGSECATLPGDEQLSLRAEAVVVPEVSGPAVPAAAIRTDDAGGAYVLMQDSTRRTVTRRGQGQGLAVVDGLAVGERIRLEPTVTSPTVGAG
jgi:peptidoglycan hydrolase-like protein with peptidoglycan-binding domain